MAGSIYAGKILLGGTTVLIGTAGSIYLAKDHIWAKNELKDLTFLPWDCRKEGATGCELSKSDLKKILFKFGSSGIEEPKLEDGESIVATLKWKKIQKGFVLLDFLFTLKSSSESLELNKNNGSETDKITISSENGVRFQIKKDSTKYFFEKTNLTSWDAGLISVIKSQNKLIFNGSNDQNASATQSDATTKLSITVSGPTDTTVAQNKKFALKVAFSGKTENDKVFDEMKTWECTIEGTTTETSKTLWSEESDNSNPISKLKKSFGIEQSSSNGVINIGQNHKNAMEKFIKKCVDLAKAQSNLDTDKKLSRTVDRALVAVTDNGKTDKLQFQNLEEFFTTT